MRKFYVQHLKGKISILEIEGEIDTSVKSSLYLKEGEFAFNICKPESLKGERYMWFALRDSEQEAIKLAYQDIEKSLEVRVSKGKISPDEVPTIVLQEKEQIEVVRLK